MSLNCLIVGAGNLATHLALSLKLNGYNIKQVFSRTENSAKELAEKLDSEYTINPEEIYSELDIYFIAIKDDAFSTLLPMFNFKNKLIVHCAGSMPLSVLKSFSENIGVLYPLQTFSKNKKVDFNEIPIFIEANNEENLDVLKRIALKLSGKVVETNSEQRMALHIAAVFACNFTNHFYTLAEEILADNNLGFELIQPLIEETATKVKSISPFEAQTGPAIRNDQLTMDKHIKALSENKDLAELYKMVSKSIFELHKKSD